MRYHYFVAYNTRAGLGWGNEHISLERPITEMDDVKLMAEAISENLKRKQQAGADSVVVINYILLHTEP